MFKNMTVTATLLGLSSFVFVPGLVYAADNLEPLNGTYQCYEPGNDSNASELTINASKKFILVTDNETGGGSGVLMDRTDLLSPIEKVMGFTQFEVLKNGQSVTIFKFFLSKTGKLIIDEHGSLQDNSQDSSWYLKDFGADALCTRK